MTIEIPVFFISAAGLAVLAGFVSMWLYIQHLHERSMRDAGELETRKIAAEELTRRAESAEAAAHRLTDYGELTKGLVVEGDTYTYYDQSSQLFYCPSCLVLHKVLAPLTDMNDGKQCQVKGCEMGFPGVALRRTLLIP